MGRRPRQRLLVGGAGTLALAVVVLFPPWRVVRLTPHGAVPTRVAFSFLLGGGPRAAGGGMYAERSSVKVDWLALEIAAVAAATALALLMVPGHAPASARRDPRSAPPEEFQSSPGEPFDQHAARLARLWREAPRAAPEPPATSPPPGHPLRDGAADEASGEFQSSPGEPFAQHAARLKRLWRAEGDADDPEGTHDDP